MIFDRSDAANDEYKHHGVRWCEYRAHVPWCISSYSGHLLVALRVHDNGRLHIRCEAWERRGGPGQEGPVFDFGATYSEGAMPALRCSGPVSDGNWLHADVRVESGDGEERPDESTESLTVSAIDHGRWFSIFVRHALSADDEGPFRGKTA